MKVNISLSIDQDLQNFSRVNFYWRSRGLRRLRISRIMFEPKFIQLMNQRIIWHKALAILLIP